MALLAIILGVLAIAAPAVLAQSDGPKLIKSDAIVYGKSYSEWSAGWWQWALSLPASNHPLFDSAPCDTGQSGPVFFLGGKFCATWSDSCGYSNIVRSCTVPAGKSLYVAVVNTDFSSLETPQYSQIADLRSNAATVIDYAEPAFTLDGAPVADLKNRFRVQSPAFGFTIPDDNLFTAIGEGAFSQGAYFPAVDDGIYVMLSPLPAGPHTLRLSGSFPVWDFSFDVTYQLNVVK
jgi:hypothetical protein